MLNAGTSVHFQISGGGRCLQAALSANSELSPKKLILYGLAADSSRSDHYQFHTLFGGTTKGTRTTVFSWEWDHITNIKQDQGLMSNLPCQYCKCLKTTASRISSSLLIKTDTEKKKCKDQLYPCICQRKEAKTKTKLNRASQSICTVPFVWLYFQKGITQFQSKTSAKLMRAQESKQKYK